MILHVAFMKKPRTKGNILEVVFIYLMVINFGIGGIIAFIGHVFFGPSVAAQIGWPAGSPFQYEVGVADLAFGVTALLVPWIKGSYRLAAALGNSIFLLAAAVGHIRSLTVSGNAAVYNIGAPIIIADIIMPIVVLGLAFALKDKEGNGKP